MAEVGAWPEPGARARYRYSMRVAGTISCYLPESAQSGSWRQELELGIKSRHLDVGNEHISYYDKHMFLSTSLTEPTISKLFKEIV